MKGKVILSGMLAIVSVAVTPVLADYTSIQHNLFNGVPDTSFDPNTGFFTINAVNEGLVTLNDPGALGGVVSNVSISLNTKFNQIFGTGEAQFVGGFLSLSFDYDGDGVGGNAATSHNISGPITGMLFEISQVGPNSRIDGLGRWTAANVDLPSAGWPGIPGVWPDGGGFSSIDSLSIAFNQDLSSFDWTTPISGRVESLYSLWPDDRAIPEPASLALVAVGALALIRRRR